MKLVANVFDVRVFQRSPQRTEFPGLRTSQPEAGRHLTGGRFRRIPCGLVMPDEGIGGLEEGLRSTREFLAGRAIPPLETRPR